jgi:hypothetical protein
MQRFFSFTTRIPPQPFSSALLPNVRNEAVGSTCHSGGLRKHSQSVEHALLLEYAVAVLDETHSILHNAQYLHLLAFGRSMVAASLRMGREANELNEDAGVSQLVLQKAPHAKEPLALTFVLAVDTFLKNGELVALSCSDPLMGWGVGVNRTNIAVDLIGLQDCCMRLTVEGHSRKHLLWGSLRCEVLASSVQGESEDLV